MGSYFGAETIPRVVDYIVKHVLGLDDILDDQSAEIPFGQLTITGSDYVGKKKPNINIYDNCLTKGEFTVRFTKLVVELIIRRKSFITSRQIGGVDLEIIWRINKPK